MDLYIYDKDVKLIGICDTMISLIWIKRYSSAGAFEIYAPATSGNIKLLQKCRYVYRPDIDEMMYISTVREENTDEDGKRLIVSGYGVEGIFRKSMPLVTDGTVMQALVPPGNGYKIPTDDPLDVELPKDTDKDYRLMDCEEIARYALDLNELSLRCSFKGGLIKPYIYKGRDLSADMVFSESFDNLKNAVYEYCEEGCCNWVNGFVKPPDIDVEYVSLPTCQFIEPEKSGIEYTIKNIVIDPIIKEGERTSGSGATIKYKYVDGKETLAALETAVKAAYVPISESFTAELDLSAYRSRFDVGDIVTIRDDVRGISYAKRIEEVQESFDANGCTVSATFGQPLKTIYDLIK